MSRSEIQDCDRQEMAEFIDQHWYGKLVITLGRQHYPHKEQGFIERHDGRIAGVLTYRVDEEGMQILTVNSALEGRGVGSSLMLDATEKARKLGCRRIWLTSTNENLRAIGFYQRLGFRLVAVHLDTVEQMRKLKPRIPMTDPRGIPIQDEFVMELKLEPYLDA